MSELLVWHDWQVWLSLCWSRMKDGFVFSWNWELFVWFEGFRNWGWLVDLLGDMVANELVNNIADGLFAAETRRTKRCAMFRGRAAEHGLTNGILSFFKSRMFISSFGLLKWILIFGIYLFVEQFHINIYHASTVIDIFCAFARFCQSSSVERNRYRHRQ